MLRTPGRVGRVALGAGAVLLLAACGAVPVATPAPGSTTAGRLVTAGAAGHGGSVRGASAPAPAARVLDPRRFGAVGDGRHDDTRALQRALDALRPGDTLLLPRGRTYAHAGVLKVRVPRTTVTGGATLLATREATSALLLDADGVTLDGDLTIRLSRTSRRWSAFEQMGVRIGHRSGITVRGATIIGSAAAGLYVGGAARFRVERVVIRGSRADGVHITGGSHDGVVSHVEVHSPGDDGVAVVSYRSGALCHDILIDAPRLVGQRWGRAFSVVGGRSIHFRDVYATRSSSAAIYVAAEREFDTADVSDVTVEGGTLVQSNVSPSVDHGAVTLYVSRPGGSVSGVTISDIVLRDTRPTASDQVRLVTRNAGAIRHVSLRRFTIRGGGRHLLFAPGLVTAFNRTGWSYNGAAVPDHVGWH